MSDDLRRLPNYSVIETFKQSNKALKTCKTDTTRERHNQLMNNYLLNYRNLEQYDTRTTSVSIAPTSKNYIEIKQGGITFRKAGDKLTVAMNETIDYTDMNVLQLTRTLEGGLAIIAAAAKFDNSSKQTAVDI